MPAPLPLLVVVLVLVSGASAAAQPAIMRWEMTGARRIVLQANSSVREHEVLVGWGVTTTLLFDTPLRIESTLLEEGEHFRWGMVGKSDDMLTLLPVGGVPRGKKLKLTVYFADGAAPASADFLLVMVDPPRAATLVEVCRPPRACTPYWHKAEQERVKAFQCQLELAQVRTVWRMVPNELTGLLASERMDEEGIRSKRLVFRRDFTQRAEDVLRVEQATSYRARDRVVLELWLANRSAQPWMVEDAVLVDEGGVRLKVLSVWSPGPILPGVERHRVVVEAEATEAESRGLFFLELREEGGPGRSVSLEGVTFP